MSEENTAAAPESTEGAQVQEQAAKPATVAKTKATGNLIHDVAVDIENLTKTKALNQAEKLAEDIEANYFRLGGVLKLILSQQWYEGFASFDAFVLEKFGFQVRKAHYLIQIYTQLVDKQIPWEKVAALGWTKLKDLAPVLTLENLDEWIAKASPCTVMELQAMIKASLNPGTDGASSTTTSDSVVLKFKLHNEQAEAVQSALAKAKGELTTDFDNVALAGICTGYLANASAVNAAPAGEVDLKAMFLSMGYEAVLIAFDAAFPLINLEVEATAYEESLASMAM